MMQVHQSSPPNINNDDGDDTDATGFYILKESSRLVGKEHDSTCVTDDEESSVYQTAAEDTMGDDDSASEMELANVLSQDFTNPPTKRSPCSSRTQCDKAKMAQVNGSSCDVLNTRPVNIQGQKRGSRPFPIVRDDAASPQLWIGARRGKEAGHLRQRTDSVYEHARCSAMLHGELSNLGDNKHELNPKTVGGSASPPTTPLKKEGSLFPTKASSTSLTPHNANRVVDDCNDRPHSHRLVISPVVNTPIRGGSNKTAKSSTAKSSTAKSSFNAQKHSLADEFLRELDADITGGKISELAHTTGGVKLIWSKNLNTTAGRASWRRETIHSKKTDGTVAPTIYKHHASIELAEKVINDKDRLFNVLAHEFCHLANFMVTGITNNPHGKEFKAWAAKCSRRFGDCRGIRVTTKHTYEIDYKYVWECSACGCEYKRHSRSINLQRHRCGRCKGTLRQTKPCPRRNGTSGEEGVKPTGYQAFVKKQMGIVRGENPGSPQKELMRIIASKWTKAKKANAEASRAPTDESDVDGVAAELAGLVVGHDGNDVAQGRALDP